MSNKAIYFTDLHVNRYNQFSEHRDRLKDCLRVFDDVFKYATAYKADTILFGGDMGDLPKYIYIEVIDDIIIRLSKWFRKCPNVTMYAISGNHDQNKKNFIDKPARTLLNVLALSFPKRFVLIDNDYQQLMNETVIMGIPYYEYAEHFSTALDDAYANAVGLKEEFPNLQVTLMIHQTPECALTNKMKSQTNPNDPRYKVFDLVLCGHIHKKLLINPTFLIGGNPLHRDLGDIGDEKGIWVFDLTNPARTLEFITRKDRYPEFIRMKPEHITDEIRHNAFIVPDMQVQSVIIDGSADQDLYHSGLLPKTLLTNFWKQVEGTDERLLKVGLELCQ